MGIHSNRANCVQVNVGEYRRGKKKTEKGGIVDGWMKKEKVVVVYCNRSH